MFHIKTYNKISPLGLSQFPSDFYHVSEAEEQPIGIILRSQKLHDEVLPESVQAIARAGAGTNNIPTADYTQKGIVVFNTPGANANAVKELVLAGLLLSSRGIVQGRDFVNTLTDITESDVMSKLLEKEKKRFAGNELFNKTLGIVGLGAIGSLVAEIALSLGMKVVGYDPALSVEAAWRLPAQVERMESMEQLMGQVDFITLHVPAIPATHHLINEDNLQLLKPTAVILNFARAAIVDSEAVKAALDNNRLGLFVCDFPEPWLLNSEKVIALPHIGASTAEAEENCAVMAVTQMRDFLEHGNIKNSVNYPATDMPRNPSAAVRLTFSNKNQPGVLGDVLSIMADNNINVLDMVNKSRNEVAYNILDLGEMPENAVLEALENIDAIMAIRVI